MHLRMCCIGLLLLSGVQNVLAGPPVLVKEHGDLSRIVIEGNKTFSDDQIRGALEHNLDLLALRRRLAPYSEFEQTVERLICDGYRHCGFAHVTVEVTYSEERECTVAAVSEGPRYVYGDVQVSGVSAELADLIERRLTYPGISVENLVVGVHSEETGNLLYGFNAAGEPVEQTDPVWESGKPADFHHQPELRFREPATRALREAGYEYADIGFELVPSPDGDTATLHVDVVDPGRPIVIDQITVEGAERNTPEMILEFLGLETPIHWTPELRRQVNEKLWECGRFQTFSLGLEGAADEMDATQLRINLLEYEAAPLLSEDLSAVEQVLCRAAHWFSTEAGRSNDLIVAGHAVDDLFAEPTTGLRRFQIVVSSQHGVFVETEWRRTNDESPRAFAVSVQPDRFLAMSGATGGQFEYRFATASALKAHVALIGIPDPDSEQKMSMRFGAGITSEDESGVVLQFAAAPMAMIYQAHVDDPECTIVDGILSIRSVQVFAEFEAATGRWIRFQLLEPEANESSIEIRFETDAYDRAMQRWDSHDEKPTVASLSDFIVRELVALASTKQVAAADSLISLTAFSSSLSERLSNRIQENADTEESGASFRIPWMPEKQVALPAELVGMVLTGNSLLFPRDSTFRAFGRELLLAMLTSDEQAGANIDALLNAYSTGPLMQWYAAEVIRHLNPVAARAIARAAQNRLDRRRFVSDCRQLLTRDDIVDDVITDCVETLRQLNDAQLEALFVPITTPEQRAAMIAAIRIDGSSDLDVLISLLGELWDARLKHLLRRRLITLSGGPEIRNAHREPDAGDAIRTTALAP